MNHTPGPWRLECYQSGTVYVHMRNASGKSGPRIMGPDHSDQDGHVGAHMFLHNVPAFKALTGETEADLEAERLANGKLIAAAPEMLAALKGAHEYNVHVADCPDSICAKCDELFNRMLKVVPEAIAKAEGNVKV